jgi:hypothetical protein
LGKDTVCRVEERKYSAVHAINYIFNPADRFAAQLNEIKDMLARLVNNRGVGESPQ